MEGAWREESGVGGSLSITPIDHQVAASPHDLSGVPGKTWQAGRRGVSVQTLDSCAWMSPAKGSEVRTCMNALKSGEVYWSNPIGEIWVPNAL